MNEKFIHYLWKFSLLSPGLTSTEGEEVSVIHPGTHNTNAGPDFLNARIRIGKTIWAGNVEIHVRASDWFRHEHQNDEAYSNIILHVVDEADCQVSDRNGRPVTTFVIKNRYNNAIIEKFEDFLNSRNRIPCEKLLPALDTFHFKSWAPALAVERLVRKSGNFIETWNNCGKNWDECFYRQLARSFGFRINAAAFELLASSIPLKIIRKESSSLLSLEALFFGQASVISGNDDYPKNLYKEYEFLRKKYNLVSVEPGLLKFLRLRPSNFPTIRISQFCNLIIKQEDLFSLILKVKNTRELYPVFETETSSYWNDHYIFGKQSAHSLKKLGHSSIRLLILNFVIPFIYFYGEMKNDFRLKEQALSLLESEEGEVNEEINFWKLLNMPADNAMHTQALLQLKQSYCDEKLCLECRLGVKMLQ